MANLINMQQTEYDELQTNLAALHEEIISGEAAVREKVLDLVSMEGGFYVEDISGKISTLLSSLKSEAVAQLESAFEGTETAISDYVSAVVQIDVMTG